MTRSREYNRWKTVQKYISRLKNVIHYWAVKDDSLPNRNKWRTPTSWKELDESNGYVKGLKDTPTPYTSPWDKIKAKIEHKSIRRENKTIIKDELNYLENEEDMEFGNEEE